MAEVAVAEVAQVGKVAAAMADTRAGAARVVAPEAATTGAVIRVAARLAAEGVVSMVAHAAEAAVRAARAAAAARVDALAVVMAEESPVGR